MLIIAILIEYMVLVYAKIVHLMVLCNWSKFWDVNCIPLDFSLCSCGQFIEYQSTIDLNKKDSPILNQEHWIITRAFLENV